MSRDVPRLIHHRRDARNGHAPAAQFYERIVASANHLTAYGGREVFCRSWDLVSKPGAVGTTNLARFRFRSKYGASRLTFVVTMGLMTGAGTDPRCEIDVTTGGVTTTLAPIHYGGTGIAATNAPSEWATTDRHADIAGGTDYEVLIKEINYASVLAVVAYEQTDLTIQESTPYYSALAPAAGVPIYDAHRERLLSGLSDMYRGNAGTLIHWGREDGSARTRSSATFVNLIDGATTGTPAVTAPGWYINNVYRNTTSRTTVPYQLAVYASASAGSGTVSLTGADGTDYASITVTGAAGWLTGTANLPATDAFYGLRFNSDGVNTISVFAASLIEVDL